MSYSDSVEVNQFCITLSGNNHNKTQPGLTIEECQQFCWNAAGCYNYYYDDQCQIVIGLYNGHEEDSSNIVSSGSLTSSCLPNSGVKKKKTGEFHENEIVIKWKFLAFYSHWWLHSKLVLYDLKFWPKNWNLLKRRKKKLISKLLWYHMLRKDFFSRDTKPILILNTVLNSEKHALFADTSFGAKFRNSKSRNLIGRKLLDFFLKMFRWIFLKHLSYSRFS